MYIHVQNSNIIPVHISCDRTVYGGMDNICIYIYIYIPWYMHIVIICIYINTYIERDKERDRERKTTEDEHKEEKGTLWHSI